MSRRAPLDRRLPAVPDRWTPPSELVVRFRNERGELADEYDFARLDLPPGLAPWLAGAFREHHVPSSRVTRRSAFKALRPFCRFLIEEGGVTALSDLTTAVLDRFVAWLRELRIEGTTRPPMPSSLSRCLSEPRKLLVFLHRRRPDLLPVLRVSLNPFLRPASEITPVPRLSDAELKAVLDACYVEIDEAWARFQEGQRCLAGQSADAELTEVLSALSRIGGGVAPSSAAMRASAFPFSRVTALGGLRIVSQYLHITYDTLIPYYIALAIQTAANPEPLRLIRRDCLVPHPLDEQREFVDWVKPRARGNRFRRPQRRSFDRRRPYAAPNLIRQMLAMTEPLVTHAGRQRDKLFLAQNEKSRAVAVLCQGATAELIKRFIRRGNERVRLHNRTNPARPRPFISQFTALILRSSAATSLYLASGGDITVPQRTLNHADEATTEGYVAGPAATRLREEVIARAQRFMVAWIVSPHLGKPQASLPSDLATHPARGIAHDCLDPLGGSGPGAEPGRACPHLGGCLTCPGLIIPLDVDHFARLLQLRQALEQARDRLDPARWHALYAPSHRVLVGELLPEFPSHLIDAAAALAASRASLPELE